MAGMATESKTSGTWHIRLWKGMRFRRVLNFPAGVLTPYVDGVLKMRSRDGAESLEFSVSNGDLVIDSGANTVTILKSKADMIAADPSVSTNTFRWEYGLHLLDASADIWAVADGDVRVSEFPSLK